LEDLAIATGGIPKASGRYTRGAVEGAHEVRQIGKPDVERDIGDRSFLVGEKACRVAQA